MCQLHNKGWPFYLNVQAILPNGTGAQGHHAFYPSSAAPTLSSVIDSHGVSDLEPEGFTEPNDTIPAPVLSFLTLHPSDTASIPSHTGFAEPQLPPTPGPPLTILGSETGTGKRTHDALLDIEVSTFNMSDTHQDLLSTARALASTTVVIDSAALPSAPKKQRSGCAGGNVLMTSAVKASRITPATAVVGMQGSINRIGDILERAMTAPPPPAAVAVAATAAATTSTSTSETRASDVLDHAMRIMQEEDGGLPATAMCVPLIYT
jgi:hypothetical protein